MAFCVFADIADVVVMHLHVRVVDPADLPVFAQVHVLGREIGILQDGHGISVVVIVRVADVEAERIDFPGFEEVQDRVPGSGHAAVHEEESAVGFDEAVVAPVLFPGVPLVVDKEQLEEPAGGRS